MRTEIKTLLLCAALASLLSLETSALTDYASPSQDAEGEYKSTQNDIGTVGKPEKEPTLEQAETIREKILENEIAPKTVEPEPDLDLTKPEDRALVDKIENGGSLTNEIVF